MSLSENFFMTPHIGARQFAEPHVAQQIYMGGNGVESKIR